MLSFFVQFLLHTFNKHAYLLRFWSDSHNRLWNFNVLEHHLPISFSKQIVISNIEQFYFLTYPCVTKYFFVFIVIPNISINGVQSEFSMYTLQCIVYSTILILPYSWFNQEFLPSCDEIFGVDGSNGEE